MAKPSTAPPAAASVLNSGDFISLWSVIRSRFDLPVGIGADSGLAVELGSKGNLRYYSRRPFY
jgi:hypothetical protein